MKSKILAFLFLFFAFLAFSQSEIFPFKSGEKLTYSAHYHWGFFWMEAGKVVFQLDTEKRDDKLILNMQSIGKSLPKYDWLFKVRDTFVSEATFPQMQPLKFKRANYEGKDWVRNFYFFNRKENRIILDMENNNLERRVDTVVLPQERILDVQTAVYFARLWDLKNATIGDQMIIKLIISGSFFNIPMIYQGKEIVKHKNGKKYLCHKITTKVVEGMIFRANQEISIFVSENKNQIPLVVKAPIIIGSVEAYLQQTNGVDFPKSIAD